MGKALARPEPDDRHTSLEWKSDRNAFVSVEVDRPSLQAGLEVVSLTLVVSDPAGEKRQQLHGYTLDEAFTWIRVTLKQQEAEGERVENVGDPSQLPDGRLGAADKLDAGWRTQFTGWVHLYSNADLLLQDIRKTKPAFRRNSRRAPPLRHSISRHPETGTGRCQDDRRGPLSRRCQLQRTFLVCNSVALSRCE